MDSAIRDHENNKNSAIMAVYTLEVWCIHTKISMIATRLHTQKKNKQNDSHQYLATILIFIDYPVNNSSAKYIFAR